MKKPAFLNDRPDPSEPQPELFASPSIAEPEVSAPVVEPMIESQESIHSPASPTAMVSFEQSKAARDLIDLRLDCSLSVVSADRTNLESGLSVTADILHNDRITRYGVLINIGEVGVSHRTTGYSQPSELKGFRFGPPDGSPIYASIEHGLQLQDAMARVMANAVVPVKQRIVVVVTDGLYADSTDTRSRVLTDLRRRQEIGELQLFVIGFGEADMRELKAMTINGEAEYSVNGMTKVAARIATLVRVATATQRGCRVNLPPSSDFQKV